MQKQKFSGVLQRGIRFRNAKLILCLFGIVFVAIWIIHTPANKPPGTHYIMQLDPVYHPIGSRLIREKSRSQSQLVQTHGGPTVRRASLSFLPTRIELKSKRLLNAYLVDLSHVDANELAELMTHPDALRSEIKPKKLADYPKLRECKGQSRIDWQLNNQPWGWRPWGRGQYQLVVECPDDPNATIDIWIHYGGRDWDGSH